MLLRDLQQLLGRLYGADLAADVCDYLITDAGVVRALPCHHGYRDIDEKLLIHQDGDVLDLGLFLDEAVLERLREADPREALGLHNLADFWTVLEGISHFHYVAWQAARDQCVTLLELEMQAEVDKYLGTRVLLEQQGHSQLEGALLHWLFERPFLDARLGAEEAERYRDASHLAGRYCHHLESRYPAGRPAPAMLAELRAFYRWPQPVKVSHIHRVGFSRLIL
ncbi:MAG: hypothetical protein JJT85_11615 [Chromatiales bacterium]|nr:hypothetical protein [Chromatiales bacterium]